MAMTFKPKKQQIHVPGYGVVQKEDFNNTHFAVLMKRAGSNKEAFISQHLVVESYGDLPIFADDEASKEAEQQAAKVQAKNKATAAERKALKEKALKEAEEAELLHDLEAEEAEKNKQ